MDNLLSKDGGVLIAWGGWEEKSVYRKHLPLELG